MERPDLYVVARFLNVLYGNGSPTKKTNIQMLLGVGLVSLVVDENDAEKIALTDKGIEAYHRFVDWIKETP
jgi:hypothetical protein